MWQKSLLLTIRLAGHLAYMVVLPLFFFGGAGLLLDRQFDSIPKFLLIGIGIAFILTMYWIKARLHEIINASLTETTKKK